MEMAPHDKKVIMLHDFFLICLFKLLDIGSFILNILDKFSIMINDLSNAMFSKLNFQ